MSDAPTPPALRRQRVGLLDRLIALAHDAAKAVASRLMPFGDAPAPASPAAYLPLIFARVAESVRRLIAIAARVDAGLPPPPPRKRPAALTEPEGPASPRRKPLRLPTLATLADLGVPGAQAFSDRLADLLAAPGMTELLAAEPGARRAAATVARALGMRLTPRARRPRREGARSQRPPRGVPTVLMTHRPRPDPHPAAAPPRSFRIAAPHAPAHSAVAAPPLAHIPGTLRAPTLRSSLLSSASSGAVLPRGTAAA